MRGEGALTGADRLSAQAALGRLPMLREVINNQAAAQAFAANARQAGPVAGPGGGPGVAGGGGFVGPVQPGQELLDRGRQIMAELNFQSMQVGIGDMHDLIQQQAVRTPLGQQAFELEMQNLQDFIRDLNAANLRRGQEENQGLMGQLLREFGALLRGG